MNISYSEPLVSGFNRMKKSLFQPFNLSKWINVGFTAFLAGLADCGGGSSGGGNSNIGNKMESFDWNEFYSFPSIAQDWLIEHPFWFALIITGLLFLVVIAMIITWVSSRGKFMFLQNVVKNEDEIVKPWNEFRKEGNSLFWWQFIYGWIVLLIFVLLAIYGFGVAKNIHNGVLPEVSKISFIIGFIVTIIALFIIFGYISLFLNDFIVPVMYKYRISATKAWSKFLSLTLSNPGAFIVYGLFVLVLTIAIVIIVLVAALATCCIGLILLIIPFINAVVLLPVSYTYRAFSIEFLAQFGSDFDLFTNSEDKIDQIRE
jgi:hypothetical protein